MTLSLDISLLNKLSLTVFELMVLEIVHIHCTNSLTGFCEKENKGLAEDLDVHTRTFSSTVDKLIVAEMLELVEGKLRSSAQYKEIKLGKNYIRPVAEQQPKPITASLTDPSGEHEKWLETWNKFFNDNRKLTPKMRRQINARRRKFTKVEIYTALCNRRRAIWLRTEGKQHWRNWDSFWRNDEKIHNYLNLPQDKQINENHQSGYIAGTI